MKVCTPFGARVYGELKARGIKLGDLAKATGRSTSHIIKVLHGERSSKSLETEITAYFEWKE